MTQEALMLALEKIATVNAMDYEYQAWAREALRENAMREVQRLGQEPVVGITAIRTWFKDGRVVTQTLCNSWVDTTPPQRTWVGLTDDEYAELAEEFGPFPINQIEAKLKEKNT